MTILTDDELKAVRERDANGVVLTPAGGVYWREEDGAAVATMDRRALLRHIDALEKDAARYRFWRQRQYNGLLDLDEYCDENSPQALHFDRLTDAAIDAAKEPTPLPGEGE